MFGWWRIFEADSIEREARTKIVWLCLLSDHLRSHHGAHRGSIINPLLDLISELEHALLAAISIFLACVWWDRANLNRQPRV